MGSHSITCHVAANVRKVVHVLVGLLMQRTSCQLLLWKFGFGKLKSNGVSSCKCVTHFTVSIEYIIPKSFRMLLLPACWVSQNLSAHDRHRRVASSQELLVHTQVAKNCFVDIWLLETKRRFIIGTH